MAPLADARLEEVLETIEALRRPQGSWAAQGSYWRPPGEQGRNVDVVHWGRRGPNAMIT